MKCGARSRLVRLAPRLADAISLGLDVVGRAGSREPPGAPRAVEEAPGDDDRLGRRGDGGGRRRRLQAGGGAEVEADGRADPHRRPRQLPLPAPQRAPEDRWSST